MELGQNPAAEDAPLRCDACSERLSQLRHYAGDPVTPIRHLIWCANRACRMNKAV
jgi:hypothetical protein